MGRAPGGAVMGFRDNEREGRSRRMWWPMDAAALALAGLAWILFSVIPARVVVSVFIHDPNYSHGLLFPVVAVLLAWRSRVPLAAAGDGARWPGVALLVAGGGLAALGHWVHSSLQLSWRGYVFLQGVGWLVATAGWICSLFGWQRFRILASRLGFLVFVVPLPDDWLLTLMLTLQRGVAICATGLLRAMGLVVFREGNLLNFPSLTLGVVGACSGIRSLMALFAAAAVCAVFLDLGTKRAWLLLALAPAAAVGSNILRVIATSLLAIRWGRIWLEGALHDALGLAAVLLGGAFLFAAAQGLNRGRSPVAVSPAHSGISRRRPLSLCSAALASILVLLAAALGMGHMSHHYARMARSVQTLPAARLPLVEFPRQIGPCRISGEFQLAAHEVAMLRPSDHLIRSYADDSGNEMRLTVLYWEPRPVNPGATAPPPVPHSPRLCWRYEGWDVVRSEDSASYAWLPDTRVEASLFEKSGRERLVLFWRSKDEGDPRVFSPAELRERLGTLVRSWREIPAGWVASTYQVRVETDAKGQPDEAKARAIEFAHQIAGILPEFGIGRPPGRL